MASNRMPFDDIARPLRQAGTMGWVEVSNQFRLLMKMLRSLPLLLALLVEPVVADEIVGELSFISGNRLGGLSGLTYKDGHFVLPKGAALDETTEVSIDRVSDLWLGGGISPEVESNHVALLDLTNGDELRGQLEKLDGDHVTLETWYGGTLRIKRSMCRSLKVQRLEPALYVGPDALEDWTTIEGEEAWSLHDQQLISKSHGSIGREIALPERCRIGFNVRWESVLNLRVLLFSTGGDPAVRRNGFEVIVQRRFAYLRKHWMSGDDGGSDNIGKPCAIREFVEQQQAHVELFIDRKAGTFALYVDGRQVRVWKDENPQAGDFGNWIHFIADDPSLRIFRIRAASWNGELPEADDSTHAVKLSSEGSPDFEEPIRRKRDVRAWLRDGGHITFEIRSLDETTLTGFSQAFGERKFDLNAFSRIEFNIYDENRDSWRGGRKW